MEEVKNVETVEEVEEETEQAEETTPTPTNDFKNIVIKECERIIDDYIEICKGNKDTAFLEALENPKKEKKYCVNHIMNNLAKKRIYGGADSLMYEYIHEYYVDKFEEVNDNWSNLMRSPSGGSTTPKKAKPTLKDIEEGYNALSNEEKNRIYLEQLAKYEEEAKKKALEKIKADEAKKKEKEKELAAKKKAEEQAKKEAERKRKEEEANEPLGGMFDLLW